MTELAQLTLQLESLDSEERISALRQIAQVTDEAMALFTIGLGDQDWRVRKAAVETFLQIEKSEAFIGDLLSLLHNPDNAGLRNAAIEILIGLGPLAVRPLQSEIASVDVEVRKFCIDILGEIGDPSCASELICSLADTDINVRYAAAETLGKLRVTQAVEPLLALMTDPDPGLKFTILQSLAQIGGSIPTERLIGYMKDRLLRKALFDCFAIVGGCEAIPLLVNGLCDPMRQVREAALSALYKLRDRCRSAIDECLLKADVDRIAVNLEQFFYEDRDLFKEAALAFYASVGTSRDLHPLLSCVSDERLRALALKTFAELGLGPYSRMLHALKSPQASELSSLIFVGGELGYAQGLPLAMDAVHDRDPQLRHTATRALGQLGRTTELNLLLPLLDDEVSEIQDAATDAIANIGQRQRAGVLRTVIPLLGDNDPLKRVRFVRILGLLGGEEIEKLLLNAFMDTSSLVRCEAVRSLIGRRSEAVVSGVTLVLNDESAEVRRLAVSALAEDPQIKMLPVFKRAVEDNDLWVRAAVMRALQHFSDDEARQLLLRGVEDPVGLVAIAALESSMAVFPDECRGLLEHALEHPDEEVVKAAMQQFEMLAGLDWIFPFTEKLLNHRHWDVRISAARSLGCSGLDQASFWLENRLMIEENSLVRQALALALATQLRTQRQAL